MRRALIVVDAQLDFIDGALGGPGRDKALGPLVAAAARVDHAVASVDWHPANHCSFAEHPEFCDGSWPSHCVAGTDGAKLAPAIAELHLPVFRKGTDPAVEAYNAFDGLDAAGRSLHDDLAAHAITRVYVGGFCLDYCVRATVLDALARGFDTVLLLDASAGVAPDTTRRATRDMAFAGVKFGTVEDL